MAVYDEVAEAYSRTLDPDGSGLVDPVLSELIGEVSGQHVLSLACGQGQDARLLAALGATVSGIDISEEMLRRARRHEAARPRGITYVQGASPRSTRPAGRRTRVEFPDCSTLAPAAAKVERPIARRRRTPM